MELFLKPAVVVTNVVVDHYIVHIFFEDALSRVVTRLLLSCPCFPRFLP